MTDHLQIKRWSLAEYMLWYLLLKQAEEVDRQRGKCDVVEEKIYRVVDGLKELERDGVCQLRVCQGTTIGKKYCRFYQARQDLSGKISAQGPGRRPVKYRQNTGQRLD